VGSHLHEQLQGMDVKNFDRGIEHPQVLGTVLHLLAGSNCRLYVIQWVGCCHLLVLSQYERPPGSGISRIILETYSTQSASHLNASLRPNTQSDIDVPTHVCQHTRSSKPY
jgi:hypothetical protein